MSKNFKIQVEREQIKIKVDK